MSGKGLTAVPSPAGEAAQEFGGKVGAHHRPLPSLVVEDAGMRRTRVVIGGLGTKTFDIQLKFREHVALRFVSSTDRTLALEFGRGQLEQIGRASCRERV